MGLFRKKQDGGRSLKDTPVARQLRAQARSPMARQLRVQAVQRARHARWQALVLIPMLAAVVWAYDNRQDLFGKSANLPVRVGTAIVLVLLGWAFARALGRAMGPALFKRMDSGTAGTVGFLIRLVALGVAILFALRVAGLKTGTLAAGGAFTAVILGLAAQQTIGNLIAGLVLLSARPFRVGDRVRFQAGALAGMVEGVVSSLGLLYTTLAQGEDRTMIPNSVVISAAVVPLREPASVDLRARLPAGVQPSSVQELLDDTVTVPTRARPHIGLEEVDADEVIVRIAATPESGSDGPQLADEILDAISTLAPGEHAPGGGNGDGAKGRFSARRDDEAESGGSSRPSGPGAEPARPSGDGVGQSDQDAVESHSPSESTGPGGTRPGWRYGDSSVSEGDQSGRAG
jgi:small conductance mechanosensitive channel